jgi:hypothetical protein
MQFGKQAMQINSGKDLELVALRQQVHICAARHFALSSTSADFAVQDYATAQSSIVEAVASPDTLQQVSWYACCPAGHDMAAIVLACTLAHGCLTIKVEDGDSSFYGAAFLMKPEKAARHISVELSAHVLQNVVFLVCISPIMQVIHVQLPR